nr:MAG TPA: hypothetical protein [Bacteriophage sp.]
MAAKQKALAPDPCARPQIWSKPGTCQPFHPLPESGSANGRRYRPAKRRSNTLSAVGRDADGWRVVLCKIWRIWKMVRNKSPPGVCWLTVHAGSGILKIS